MCNPLFVTVTVYATVRRLDEREMIYYLVTFRIILVQNLMTKNKIQI